MSTGAEEGYSAEVVATSRWSRLVVAAREVLLWLDEKLGWWLGLDKSKYQWYVDEAQRKAEEEEEVEGKEGRRTGEAGDEEAGCFP